MDYSKVSWVSVGMKTATHAISPGGIIYTRAELDEAMQNGLRASTYMFVRQMTVVEQMDEGLEKHFGTRDAAISAYRDGEFKEVRVSMPVFARMKAESEDNINLSRLPNSHDGFQKIPIGVKLVMDRRVKGMLVVTINGSIPVKLDEKL